MECPRKLFYISGLGNAENQLLFKRIYTDIALANDMATDEIAKVFHRQLQSNPSVSALSIMGRLRLIDNQYIDDAYRWFNEKT